MSKELTSISKISLALQISKGIFEDIFATNLSPIKPTLRKISDAKKAIPLITASLKRLEELEKALEIIKEKRVDVSLITDTQSLQEYNEKIPQYVSCDKNGVDRLLTQEEYDSLREVML